MSPLLAGLCSSVQENHSHTPEPPSITTPHPNATNHLIIVLHHHRGFAFHRQHRVLLLRIATPTIVPHQSPLCSNQDRVNYCTKPPLVATPKSRATTADETINIVVLLLSSRCTTTGQDWKINKIPSSPSIFRPFGGNFCTILVGPVYYLALFLLSFPISPHIQTKETSSFLSYFFPFLLLPFKIPQLNKVLGMTMSTYGDGDMPLAPIRI